MQGHWQPPVNLMLQYATIPQSDKKCFKKLPGKILFFRAPRAGNRTTRGGCCRIVGILELTFMFFKVMSSRSIVIYEAADVKDIICMGPGTTC